jgi:hypothetical protein
MNPRHTGPRQIDLHQTQSPLLKGRRVLQLRGHAMAKPAVARATRPAMAVDLELSQNRAIRSTAPGDIAGPGPSRFLIGSANCQEG